MRINRLRGFLKGVKAGQRKTACFELAEYFLNRNLFLDSVYHGLLAWNRRNEPPMDQRELRAVVWSALEKHNVQSASMKDQAGLTSTLGRYSLSSSSSPSSLTQAGLIRECIDRILLTFEKLGSFDKESMRESLTIEITALVVGLTSDLRKELHVAEKRKYKITLRGELEKLIQNYLT